MIKIDALTSDDYNKSLYKNFHIQIRQILKLTALDENYGLTGNPFIVERALS